MKNKILPIIAIVVLALTVTSCYSSRKSKTGCPVNVKVITKSEVNKQVS